MSKLYSINQVSKMFNIPKSTLRYWDDQGVFNVTRNTENSYRYYTRENILEICAICSYKNLDLSLKEISNISKMNLSELELLFCQTKDIINTKLIALNNTSESISKKLDNIENLKQLKNSKFKFTSPPFKNITNFHPSDRTYIENFLSNQNQLSFVANIDSTIIMNYGIIDCDYSSQSIIWEKNLNSQYLECLVRVDEKNIFDKDYIKDATNYINSLNKKAISIIGQYLITYFDEKTYDYYKAWIEIE